MSEDLKALVREKLYVAMENYRNRTHLTAQEAVGLSDWFHWASYQAETLEEGIVLEFIAQEFQVMRPLTPTLRETAIAYLEIALGYDNDQDLFERNLLLSSSFSKH